MASANVTRLQNAINRFAQASHLPSMGPAFSAIGVDGGLGPQTNQGTLNALAWVARYGTSDDIDTAASLVDKLTNGDLQTNIAQSADGLATYLEGVAESMSLPGPNVATAPHPSSGGGALPPAALHPLNLTSQGLMTQVKVFWANLATWQKIALGAGAGLLVIWGTGQKQEAKAKSKRRAS